MIELSLKEIQFESLSILEKVSSICEKLGLTYCLMYGTLIGAIRHNGFIPWDDDIDIAMPREDYKRLQNYFLNNEENLYPLSFFSKETKDEYPYMIGRICNTNFVLKSEIEKDYGMGTFIDIYPMDGAGNNKKKFIFSYSRLLSSIYYMKSRTKYIPSENKILNIPKKIIFSFSHLFSLSFLQKNLAKLTTKFSYNTSKYVTQMDCCTDGAKNIFNKNDIFTTEKHQFENISVNIPTNYDSILKQLYGDYMQLPPKEKRIGHHFYSIYRKEHELF